MMRRLVLLLALVLSGCVHDVVGAKSADEKVLFYAAGEAGGAGKRLIPFTTIAGYMQAAGTGPGTAARLLTGLGDRQATIRNPVALGAGPGGVYILDGNTLALYRFRWQVEDPSHGDAKHIAESHGGLSHPELVKLRVLTELQEPNDLYVAPNGDIFVSDGKGGRAVRYDKDGRFLQEFADPDNMRSPVGLTVDSRGLRVFVADSLYDRVVVFGNQGRSLYAIGSRGDGPGGFRNIRTMVQGRNGLLYVVNGLRQQIQAYGIDGTHMGSFGQGTFTEADGIAVDDDNRLYLSDRFNHRLLVFVDGKVAEIYGTHGIRPGEFNQPGRIAYHQGHLFVADRQNSRVQVFRVVPESYLSNGGRQ